MHRKHYQKIAKVFSDEKQRERTFEEAEDSFYNLALGLADVLQEENPNFDRGRFMAAIEGEPLQETVTLDVEGINRLRNQASEYAEAGIGVINETLTDSFDNTVKAILADWNKRFHRHTFTATAAMGSFFINVNPPVCGTDQVEFLYSCPGVIGEIGTIALALGDWFCDEHSRVSVCDSGDIVS